MHHAFKERSLFINFYTFHKHLHYWRDGLPLLITLVDKQIFHFLDKETKLLNYSYYYYVYNFSYPYWQCCDLHSLVKTQLYLLFDPWPD